MTARLETLEPAADWDRGPHEAAIERLRDVGESLDIHVWGGDWCRDCQAVLPSFAAALEAADIDPDTVRQYPVTKADDGTKHGPLVDAYDITLIPTIVFEVAGNEVARFEEQADRPAIEVLTDPLAASP